MNTLVPKLNYMFYL